MGISTDFIKQRLLERAKSDSSISVAPNIPEKKLVNAANKIANGIDPATIVAIQDTSLFENGKEGIVFTGTTMYIKRMLEETKTIPYNDMQTVDLSVEKKTDEKGKVHVTSTVTIKYNDNHTTKLVSQTDDKQLHFITEILNEIIESVDSFKDVVQIAKLEELGDDIIEMYISIVTNYLIADDGIISSAEYKELISLMARVNVSKESAKRLRNKRLQLAREGKAEDFGELIKELNTRISEKNVDHKGIDQSLFFDLLLVRKENIDNWKEDTLLRNLQDLLVVSDEQVEVGIRKIKDDERIVSERMEDSQIKQITNELVALAGGAGVTLAALAVTGGVSTGIWGGLLTLGLLPTGSMLLGLAAIGGVGYGAYKGIKYFSGTSEYEKSGIRIAALQGAIEMNKKATTYIIEDINALIEEINDITKELSEKNERGNKVKELKERLGLLEKTAASAESFNDDNKKNNYEIYLSKLPKVLPVERFRELNKLSAQKVKINEIIMSIYKENKTTDENGYVSTQYVREDELSYEDAEKTHFYLSMIGFYDTKASAMAQGQVMAQKGLNAIKSFIK